MYSKFDELFRISVFLKGLDALAEIIGGLFLLIVSPNEIKGIIHWLTAGELHTDPHDFIANLLVHFGHGFNNGSRWFAAAYLLSHGVIKMFVIVNVLRNKYWAYPLLIVVLLGFIVYQIIQITHTHSVGLILLSIFDAFIIVLTALEWRKQHERRERLKNSEGQGA